MKYDKLKSFELKISGMCKEKNFKVDIKEQGTQIVYKTSNTQYINRYMQKL